jgi:hypothetical protein
MESYYDKVLETVEQPTWILRGHAGALVAVLSLAHDEYLNVVYREVSLDDGFIVTAFVSLKVNQGLVVWPKKS